MRNSITYEIALAASSYPDQLVGLLERSGHEFRADFDAAYPVGSGGGRHGKPADTSTGRRRSPSGASPRPRRTPSPSPRARGRGACGEELSEEGISASAAAEPKSTSIWKKEMPSAEAQQRRPRTGEDPRARAASRARGALREVDPAPAEQPAPEKTSIWKKDITFAVLVAGERRSTRFRPPTWTNKARLGARQLLRPIATGPSTRCRHAARESRGSRPLSDASPAPMPLAPQEPEPPELDPEPLPRHRARAACTGAGGAPPGAGAHGGARAGGPPRGEAAAGRPRGRAAFGRLSGRRRSADVRQAGDRAPGVRAAACRCRGSTFARHPSRRSPSDEAPAADVRRLCPPSLVCRRPSFKPPVSEPPVSESPVSEPPVSEPPVSEIPPMSEPPVRAACFRVVAPPVPGAYAGVRAPGVRAACVRASGVRDAGDRPTFESPMSDPAAAAPFGPTPTPEAPVSEPPVSGPTFEPTVSEPVAYAPFVAVPVPEIRRNPSRRSTARSRGSRPSSSQRKHPVSPGLSYRCRRAIRSQSRSRRARRRGGSVEPPSRPPIASRRSSAKRAKRLAKDAPNLHKQLVGLKIGGSQIAAAQVVNKGGPRIIRMARAPLDRGVVVGGEVRKPDELAAALKTLFRKNKLPRNCVRLGISNNRIGVRTFEISGSTIRSSSRTRSATGPRRRCRSRSTKPCSTTASSRSA